MRGSLKDTAREIYHEVRRRVSVTGAFEAKLPRDEDSLFLTGTTIDLATFSDLLVVSMGKAAEVMTLAFLDRISVAPSFTRLHVQGVIASATETAEIPSGFQYFRGGHPVPDDRSEEAADAILELLSRASDKSLIAFLVSGGGSSLVEKPLPPLTLDDLRETHRVLTICGAPIADVNTLRKHLSMVKGGRLAQRTGKAQVLTLLLSDVPEGRPDLIASGPTLPDPTTVENCREVIERWKIRDALPEAVRMLLDGNALEETPGPEDPAFRNASSHVLLSSRDVIEAGRRAAEELGFRAAIDIESADWSIEDTAPHLLSKLQDLKMEDPSRPACVISGGAILSPVTGNGRGGRNQAFVLHCVPLIAGKSIVILSAGTDGIDGNSPAAGAVADGLSMARALAIRLNPGDSGRNSDSYPFFSRLGDAILTGPRPGNLRDLRLVLCK
jgi:hydroxypyruvate reductase